MRASPLHVVSAVAAAVLLLAAAPPARAQITNLQSGFSFAVISADLSKQVEIGTGDCAGGDSSIYYGTLSGLVKRSSPTASPTTCDPSLTFPAGIAFGNGGSFGTFMYVADFGVNNVWKLNGCAAGVLFATLNQPGSIVIAPAGSPFGDFMYGTTAFSGPIVRINSSGTVTPWLTLNSTYLKFGPGGDWGFDLYSTNTLGPPNSQIVSISSAKLVTPRVTGLVNPEGFDWGFGGDLFSADLGANTIYRVKPDGTKTLFATLPGVADVAWRCADQSLYVVSNQGGFYRIYRTNPTGVGDGPAAAGALRAAPNPFRGTVQLSFTTAVDGIARVRVVDASGRLVRRLSAAWRPAGPQSLTWDGVDDAGMAVRPGVYFASVTAPGGTRQVARLTITD